MSLIEPSPYVEYRHLVSFLEWRNVWWGLCSFLAITVAMLYERGGWRLRSQGDG